MYIVCGVFHSLILEIVIQALQPSRVQWFFRGFSHGSGFLQGIYTVFSRFKVFLQFKVFTRYWF